MKHRLRSQAAIATISLIVFWAILFLATHMPLPSIGLGKHLSDKILHFSAYAGLAALLCWAVSSRRKFTVATWGVVVVVTVVYGAVDELLQIPIQGRTAELGDWAADVGGAVCGTLAFALLCAAAGARRPRSRPTNRTVEIGRPSHPPAETGGTRPAEVGRK
jgi:VanZ family protein